MRDAEESWKYTSILLGADQREFFAKTTDGEGNPIEIFKRKSVKRTTISKVCREEGLDEQGAYNKYFKDIFSDTNAQTSIRARVIDAVGSLDDDEIIEVEYVPRSGRDKGQKVKHTYISRTVRRVIWLSDVAERSGSEVIKKEKIGTYWGDFDFNNVGKEGDLPFPDGKKPIDLIKRCINLYSENSGIVLDFFAGSCSTAHAVLDLNYRDGGSRRFIMIQMLAAIDPDSKKYEAAVKYYREAGIKLDIADVGRERIRRAAKRLREEFQIFNKNIDDGYRTLRLDASNFKSVYYSPDSIAQSDLLVQESNIREDRTSEDLLFQVMLDWGVDLGLPISSEKIAGQKVFFVDGNALAACFDTDISEELVTALAKRRLHDLPLLKVVFRDAGYASDSAKINVEQIFKLLSSTTEIRTL